MPKLATGSSDRRRAINSKITDDLRAKLQDAARKTGRSVSYEIESRLEDTFAERDRLIQIFSNEDVAALALTFCGTVKRVQDKTGKSFLADMNTFAAAVIGLATTVRFYADLVGKVDNGDYPGVHGIGTDAAKAAIRAVNPTLTMEFLDEPRIDESWIDPDLYDPTKPGGALRAPKRAPSSAKAK